MQTFFTKLYLKTTQDNKSLNFEDVDEEDESKSGKMKNLRE